MQLSLIHILRPFLSDKYDITKHPNFKYTADADEKNAFDIEAFLSARLKLKPNEVCDCLLYTSHELMAVLDTCTEAQRRRFLLLSLIHI